LKEGINMATIKDVAKLAGVSPSTVSRALSGRVPVDEETKKKVMEAVDALNYRPNILAKGLREGKTNTIGLVLPNIRNPIFPAVARGVEDIARQKGYTVILCNTDGDRRVELDYIEKLKERWVDGFIFATAGDDAQHILDLKDQGIPVVLLVRNIDYKVDAVVIDNFKAAYMATNYLIDLGYRKIALINGSPTLSLYKERLDGYKSALRENNITMDYGLIVQDIELMEDAYIATKTLLNEGVLPDAILATSDPKAYGVMGAIRDRELTIPRDIAVMGFDDLDIGKYMNPSLTAIAQPWYEMGVAAMTRFIELMENRNEKPKVDIFDAHIVERGSTKRA
jgi:LacI family transcriptional regulator